MLHSTALEFGLINLLRSGHVLTDLLVCLFVPALTQRLLQKTETVEAREWIKQFLTRSRKFVTHTVEMTEQVGTYGVICEGDTRSQNVLLQKAIAAYLAKQLNMDNKSGRYHLTKKMAQTASDKPQLDIATLQVGILPPTNEWVHVEDGIEFMHETEHEEADDESKVQQDKTLYHFRSSRADGPERIDKLVQNIFAQYQEAERKKSEDDNNRYMFVGRKRRRHEVEDSDDPPPPTHKRYKLSDDKTFDNLFFDGKEELIEQLDNFTRRRDKFAIEGVPYKYGLLLYGPPGTGKTSVIKAIAHHTQRHIVTLPLGKIKTNQALMDAMFDLRYRVAGRDTPVSLTFRDVIFVMEDIDCASEVVKKRTEDAGVSAQRPQSPLSGLVSDSSDDELFAALASGKGQLGPAPLRGSGFVSSSNASDKLNLAGLLNILDGFIDCPGRMVIMTTNHPEKLDPALIRPGRVSKKLHLGYMSGHQMRLMIEYYCQVKLTAEQRERLDSLSAEDRAFTPADIEELCAEYEDVEAIISAAEVLPPRNNIVLDEKDEIEEESRDENGEEDGNEEICESDDEDGGAGDLKDQDVADDKNA
ncbi:TPA: hypothetical protein N0F65_006306 [Lagenidium giganteum]|uniref:AAA+ ATPase domain-containing protein n=1 Tax=Lagenidium giganteum TaxID=4803 RepID=A0AAV2YMP5_9STRA|nr:TPA: hypothetical protein N0F65_006306 [Lagenidium giganteum]